MPLLRRRLRLSLLAIVLLGALPASASALATQHSVAALSGNAEVSGLPLRSARLAQSGAQLRLRVSVGRGRGPVAGGSTVCASLRAPTSIDWCFVRHHHAWTATLAGKPAGRVTIPARGWIATQLPLATLGASPGAFRWSVTSHEPTCDASPYLPCNDRLPADGAPSARGHLWTPVATGCSGSAGKLITAGPQSRRVALTFDDGPSTYTAQIQAILRREGVHATFFLIGRQVAADAADLRTALADGDELGDHSWDHPLHAMSGGELTSEITRTQDAIRTATGFTPCLFRPPGGFTGPGTVSGAGALGLATVLWTVDPRDWARPGTDAIVSGVLGHTTPGAIILNHDGGGDRSQTIAALPTVIETLKQRGYAFDTVSQLIGNTTIYGLRPT